MTVHAWFEDPSCRLQVRADGAAGTVRNRSRGVGCAWRHGWFAARSLHCGLRPPVEMTREDMVGLWSR
jgi:hypothetical protein